MDTAIATDHLDNDGQERGGDALDGLVRAAQRGERSAWQELIAQFTPLVVCVTRGYRLSQEDAQDVSQMVWLKLYENITRLREPRALPGWIRTTTQHESLRVVKAARRTQVMDPSVLASFEWEATEPEVDKELLRMESVRAVNDGLNEIEPHHRTLLVLLHAQERPSYQAIGESLGMPTGSIGPTRARVLQKLRRTKSISTFLQTDRETDLLAAG